MLIEAVLRGAQEEREEKLRIVGVYNGRLTERERRRDFLRARDLLNMKRMQASTASRRQPYDRRPQQCVNWSVCELALINKLQEVTSSITVL